MSILPKSIIVRCGWIATALTAAATLAASARQVPPIAADQAIEFIDTSIENGSPLWYDVVNGVVRIHLLYDHERRHPIAPPATPISWCARKQGRH